MLNVGPAKKEARATKQFSPFSLAPFSPRARRLVPRFLKESYKSVLSQVRWLIPTRGQLLCQTKKKPAQRILWQKNMKKFNHIRLGLIF